MKAKMSNEKMSSPFLRKEDNNISVNGPKTATIIANALNNQPAFSIETPNADARSDNIPITPNSVVVIPKIPSANT